MEPSLNKSSAWRSLLFVPASRPERFVKALSSGADAVCVDLEDAVAPEAKEASRALAARFLAAADVADRPARVVRINSIRTLDGLRDVLAIAEVRPHCGFIAVPKVESAEEVEWIVQLIADASTGLALIVQIETLEGVERAAPIATASGKVSAVMFGGLDLAAELGIPASWDALAYGRARVAHAAARAGLGAIDMPYVDVHDVDGCAAEARRARAVGFTAKMAIHPRQVQALNDAFTPTHDEQAQARRIIDAWQSSRDAVIQVDGRMIERPVVAVMQRILARTGMLSDRPLRR